MIGKDFETGGIVAVHFSRAGEMRVQPIFGDGAFILASTITLA